MINFLYMYIKIDKRLLIILFFTIFTAILDYSITYYHAKRYSYELEKNDIVREILNLSIKNNSIAPIFYLDFFMICTKILFTVFFYNLLEKSKFISHKLIYSFLIIFLIMANLLGALSWIKFYI